VADPSVSSRRRTLLAGVASGRSALRRVAVALGALAAVTVVGTVGYTLLGFSLLEALYQTVTTVATVGFREVRPLSAAGMVFTIVLILIGVGTVLYNLGILVEAVTEGHLREYLERRHMDQRITRLSGHVVICGYGRVGRAAASHLQATGHDVVVIDRDPERLVGADLPHIVGDALDDDTLREAGIARARALIAALHEDADTLYLTLSARALGPDLVVVARARTVDAKAKLVLAGADRAVNPQLIGGRRMAAFALHPDVAEFLDVVLHDEEIDYRIAQVRVPPGSPLIGRAIGDVDVTGRSGAQLLAVRRPTQGAFVPRPPDSMVVEAGSTLIVFGDPGEVSALQDLVGAKGDLPMRRPQRSQGPASPAPESQS
jgi:voltage-gated potassium channel